MSSEDEEHEDPWALPYQHFETAILVIKERWESRVKPEDNLPEGWTPADWAEDMLHNGVTQEVWERASWERRLKVWKLVKEPHNPALFSGTFPSAELLRAGLAVKSIPQEKSWFARRLLAIIEQYTRVEVATLRKRGVLNHKQLEIEVLNRLSQACDYAPFKQWLSACRYIISEYWNHAVEHPQGSETIIIAILRACDLSIRRALEKRQGKVPVPDFLILYYLPTLEQLLKMCDNLLHEFCTFRKPADPFFPQIRPQATSSRIAETDRQRRIVKFKHSVESAYRLQQPLNAGIACRRLNRLWETLSDDDQEKKALSYLTGLVALIKPHELPLVTDLPDNPIDLPGYQT